MDFIFPAGFKPYSPFSFWDDLMEPGLAQNMLTLYSDFDDLELLAFCLRLLKGWDSRAGLYILTLHL